KELQKKQSEEKKEDKEIKRKSVLPEDEKKDEMKVMRQVSEKEEKKKELSESIRGKTEAVSKQQTTVASTIESAIGTLRGNGKPLTTDERSYFEPRMKEDFSDVRIHTDSHAGELAQAINAQAFTIKNDIVFGAGKYQPGNTTGRMLMAHELGHVVQQRGAVAAAERKSPSLIAQGSPEMAQLRAATFLERRAWLAFFDHYLPRKFLNNYMDDTGNPITLTRQEMIDCNAVVDIRRSGGFRTELAQLTAAGGGSAVIDVSGWAGAMTNGTLGNFTIYYHGTLTVNPNGTWTFNGTMTFYDYWDFNTGGANRPLPAEIKVRVANAFLPGQPFHIYSVPVQVSQSNADNQVQWNARTPRHVPDRAARTGADIEVGTETGGVDIGSEAGAQSAEDLNR
ncbi:MAG: DUF4157 domain-containing protein, partial [Chitinivibrionales bacterium]|nr:DUF4157 domain-containing protein [Chitinivibrionales bacterium]